jgi:hypothetical protein
VEGFLLTLVLSCLHGYIHYKGYVVDLGEPKVFYLAPLWSIVTNFTQLKTCVFKTNIKSISIYKLFSNVDTFSFESDLETLGKVPVLPALLEKESSECCEGEGEDGEARPQDPLSLLQWISAKDHQFSLQQVADQCRKGLDQVPSSYLTF